MEIEKTLIADCFILKPKIFKDDRGLFFESFHAKKFKEIAGIDVNFVQDNQSFSTKGVLRGLHFQKGVHAQAKLVRVVQGEVLDVAVDLRKDSSTFGKHISVLLNDTNNHQLFVPRGFAHGFVVLSKTALFSYKCDNYYDKNAESGIRYNDPELNVDWKLNDSQLVISEKDKELPYFDKIMAQNL